VDKDKFLHSLACLTNRIPMLFITSNTLGEFLTTGDIFDPVHVAAPTISADTFKMICSTSNVDAKLDSTMAVLGVNGCSLVVHLKGEKSLANINQELIAAPKDTIEELKSHRKSITATGLWKKYLCPEKPYFVTLPYRYGTVMDLLEPKWFVKAGQRERPFPGIKFLVGKRVEHGVELLQKIFECGERAGIRDAMWLGFGCCLGYIMCGGFIPKDNDIDICIDSDKITKEQEDAYFQEIKKPFSIGNQEFPHGLCESRFMAPSVRQDTKRALWTSIGHRNIASDFGLKACHWFWFNHGGISWHSKGGRWVKGKSSFGSGMDTCEALCLGIPESVVSEKVEIDFLGVKVRVPLHAGTCCDWWYPGWDPAGEGSSARRIVMSIGKWEDQKTWRIV